MTVPLYEFSVSNYLQTLGAVGAFLDKARAHFREAGVALEEIVETRLYPDMLPFRFQVQSVVHHSVGAIEGLRQGVFRPPSDLPQHGYEELQKLVADARETLQKVAPEPLNARAGADMVFEIRGTKVPFTTEGFVLSFSLPNFYFHATTAYDILRSKGAPLGKRDYLGRMRLKS
jgi:uncharacterized protein